MPASIEHLIYCTEVVTKKEKKNVMIHKMYNDRFKSFKKDMEKNDLIMVIIL